MRWDWLLRQGRAAIGDDGTAGYWPRLTPDGREVLRLAFVEARELGHPCRADEHVLLGLLRHGNSEAAALLRTQGLDPATVCAELLRVGPTLGRRVDPAGALRSLGIEVEEVRRRLEDTFGARAVAAAEMRVRRRPRWRGGHSRPNPMCVYLGDGLPDGELFGLLLSYPGASGVSAPTWELGGGWRALALLSGRSISNPSMADSRHRRRNDPRAVPNATTPAVGPARPATGPQVRSNNSGNTLRPNRLRAWVIAEEVGTDQGAFQQFHRSSDPVTLVATSS